MTAWREYNIREMQIICNLQRFNIELEQIKKHLKEARTDLQRKTCNGRKNDGRDRIITECEEAGLRGDSGAVYKKLKELGTRGIKQALDSTNITKEQFKDHFQKVSKDRFKNDPEDMEAAADLVENISKTE